MSQKTADEARDALESIAKQAGRCCYYCQKTGERCVYHKKTSAAELFKLLQNSLVKSKDGSALEQYLTSATAGVQLISEEILPLLAEQDVSKMLKKFEKWVDEEKFDSLKFRRVAGLCLAIAAVLEAQDALDPEGEELLHG